MSVIHPLSARLFGRGAAVLAIALAATAAFTSVPVGAASSGTCTNGPVLDLANPSAGDVLSSGDYLVSGVARDSSGASGGGIDRVDLFVGSRDFGGTEVASVVPQQGVFEVTAKLPTNISGGTNFVAYAHSAATGQETSVSVPVYLGAAPTPTPRTTDMAATPVVSVTAQVSCAPANAASAAIGTSAVVSTAPILQLANPSSGDTMLLGDYIVSGIAYVPDSAQGLGVDRVEFFLGSRDNGGTYLGSAVPGQNGGLNATSSSQLAMGGFATKVTVPAQLRGTGTTFYAYAQNAITGQETVVSAPVYVGAAPTPTPRPSSSS